MPDYLKRQLIAYIGNKRALLPFLERLFLPAPGRTRPGVFLDPFAGSGAVSRLARTLGYEVHANDWETYAWVMNQAYLTLTPAKAEALFASRGGLARVLDELNALKLPKQEFVAAHYAPQSTDHPDPTTERLFYTRENALFLDAVRERIEEDWGPGPSDAKTLLLALLVYEASVHSNTSGVFKAFHKGFGGHGGDALGRILSPMQLEYPVLWDGPAAASATCLDAVEFLRGRTGEICYLDPPYNQHQYGSNYHLLNTVARGDRPAAEKKAGIRQDWKTTKSPFCSKLTALPALDALLDAVDARTLVVSYNTEGIIPFELLHDRLDRRGRVTCAVQDYVTYRGGRQSLSRRAHNLEFVLVVDTTSRPRSGDKADVERFLAEKRLGTLLKGRFHPGRLREAFPGRGQSLDLGRTTVETWRLYTLADRPDVAAADLATLSRWAQGFAHAAFRSHQEESETLFRLLETPLTGAETTRLERRLLQVIRKFAFAKYADEIAAAFDRLRDFVSRRPSPRLEQGIRELESLLALRIGSLQFTA